MHKVRDTKYQSSVPEVLYLSWLHAVYVHVNVHVQFAMAISFILEHVCIVQ